MFVKPGLRICRNCHSKVVKPQIFEKQLDVQKLFIKEEPGVRSEEAVEDFELLKTELNKSLQQNDEKLPKLKRN